MIPYSRHISRRIVIASFRSDIFDYTVALYLNYHAQETQEAISYRGLLLARQTERERENLRVFSDYAVSSTGELIE